MMDGYQWVSVTGKTQSKYTYTQHQIPRAIDITPYNRHSTPLQTYFLVCT
jgi:hypothetical protein